MRKKFDPEQLEESMLRLVSILGFYSMETEPAANRINMTSFDYQMARIPIAPVDSYMTIKSLLLGQPDYLLMLEQLGLPFGDRDFTGKQFHCALKLCLIKYEDARLIRVEESLDGLDWIVYFSDAIIPSPRDFYGEIVKEFVQKFYMENQKLRMTQEPVKRHLELTK